MDSTQAATLLVIPGESELYYAAEQRQDDYTNNYNENANSTTIGETLLARGTLTIDLVPVPLYNNNNENEKGGEKYNNNYEKGTAAEYDEWLLLRIDDSIEIPLSSFTTVTTVSKGVYTIPIPQELSSQYTQRYYNKDDTGVILKLLLPNDSSNQDTELLEIILNQRTALVGSDQTKDYKNRIVLIDEPTGQVIGDLDSGAFTINRDASLDYHQQQQQLKHHQQYPSSLVPPPLPPRRPSSGLPSPTPSRSPSPSPAKTGIEPWNNKEPVVLDLHEQDHSITVIPLSQYSSSSPSSPSSSSSSLATSRKSNSKIVNAADFISRGILYTSGKTTSGLSTVAQTFTEKTKQTNEPMVFKSSTHTSVERIGRYTGKAAHISKKTVGSISRIASEMSEHTARKSGITPNDKNRNNPGKVRKFVNNSFVAFNTILDSVEEGGKAVLHGATESSSKMIEHRYGQEAGNLTKTLGSSGTNVALVYIDARGVSRKALLRSAGKGFIRARMSDGREVVLGDEQQSHSQQKQ